MNRSTNFVIVTKGMQVYAYNTPDGKLIIGDVQPVLEFNGEYFALNIEKLDICKTNFFFNEKDKIFTVTDNCPRYKSDMVNLVMNYIKEQKSNLFSYDVRVDGHFESVKLEIFKRIEGDEEYVINYGSRSLYIVANNSCLVNVELDYFIPVSFAFKGLAAETRTENIRVIAGKYEVMGHSFETAKAAQEHATKKILAEMFPTLFPAAQKVKTVIKEQEEVRTPITQFRKPFMVMPEIKASATKEPEQPLKKYHGRKPTPKPANFDTVYVSYINKCITGKDAARMCGVSYSVFKRMAKEEN